MAPRRATGDRVCLGRIGGVNGVHGAVSVQTYTSVPDDIDAYGPLTSENGERQFELKVLRRRKSGVVVRIAGVDDRATAEGLKGIRLYVPRSALPEPEGDDEYYCADLIGMTAIDMDGAILGDVISVENYGAGDILEVKSRRDGRTVLLPFTLDVVPEVDKPAAVIRVDLPDSLRKDLD